MYIPAIHEAFCEMIQQPLIQRRMRISGHHARYMRWRIRHGKKISLEIKLKYLQRAGWRLDQFKYTHDDLIDLVRFVIKTGDRARQFGPSYIVEKWEKAK